MRFSIQTKLLTMCLMLVFLTAGGISYTYYILTMQDKQRESQQRLQIAFDIVLNDLEKRVATYTERFNQFLKQNTTILAATYAYRSDDSEWGTIKFLYTHYQPVVDELKTFGSVALANRVMLYGGNKRLLVVYQNLNDQERTGAYLESEDEGPIYLAMDNPDIQSEIYRRGLEANQGYFFKPRKLQANPLPAGVLAYYDSDIPDSIKMTLFQEGQQFGIRMVAPIYRRQEKIALLVGEVLYTQAMADEYALLSNTAVNLYVGHQLSIGTLRSHATLEPELLPQLVACADLLARKTTLTPLSFELDGQDYYQGRCVLKNTQGEIVGALTASLSKNIERQAIQKIVIAVLTIAGLASAIAFGLSVVFSRKTIHSIHDIVSVIGTAAAGDLRKTVIPRTHDEIETLAVNLNQMIAQLRSISGQVQQASLDVHTSADAILRQMGDLIRDMQQQSSSVEATTVSIEKIQTFITEVTQNTATVLASATQILAAIQQMRANISEITSSTEFLTTNLHLISSSAEHVNQTIKQITDGTGQLEEVVRLTETEIQRINHSLQNVALNADHTQEMARETMHAARHGQTSVDAAMQGMLELKTMVGNTAQIIQEINSWGQQVSSILNIVDEITSQTSLLALNAAIISAQAGSHGRGFAVVADEIKGLADQTKASTQQISTLVHALQKKTEEGVRHIQEGLQKTDQEMQLASAVQDALTSILDHATHSSDRAADTAQVIQQTVASSQAIDSEMNKVGAMVSGIRTALQGEHRNLDQVARAVENISGTADQVNHASAEQKIAMTEIERSMIDMTGRFGNTSHQTGTLQADADQIVSAMRIIRTITEQSLQNATTISNEPVNALVSESDKLQNIVKIFKVA